MDRIRVLIADDHELVRLALRTLLEGEDDIEVVAEAADADSAVNECANNAPDVVILDLRMPGGGVNACRSIRRKCPNAQVLVLTSFNEDDELFGVLDAGASGYLLKDTRPERLVHAIRSVHEGQSVFDTAIAGRLIAGRPSANSVGDGEPLSEREMEVLGLMAQGYSNKEIGKALWIGETTVKTHVSHILRKLGQSDRTQAVLAAVKSGIVQLDT